jgi:peptide chain release factor 3
MMILAQDQQTNFAEQIGRRRTFAIISHPDAGKTTLTEKLLLYGDAIQLAGNVRARRNQSHTTSDWMALERERGISITSTVLQFPYEGRIINLLDTPGHADFSEDTYRTLMAADSAAMVLDAAKGVEAQTLKLFEVCRQRGIPVFTFINKMDRPVEDPLGLLDEVERVLGMTPVPMNWPLGDGPSFQGVYNRATGQVHLFDRTIRNETAVPETITTLDAPSLQAGLGVERLADFFTNIELLDGLGLRFDHQRFLRGDQTPVYFGSALTNFGVRLFLDDFVRYAPAPGVYGSDAGPIQPHQPAFSGFVFKIQANMDPRHRDSVAFVRICSGRFERGMTVTEVGSGTSVRLSRSYKFFADDRETVEDAYAGDIIGLPGNRHFTIGDTLTAGEQFRFDPIPRFAPEHFARLINLNLSKYKQFNKGLSQLAREGVVQVLYETDAQRREPILAVVGVLQFEVMQARLQDEYGVDTKLDPLPYQLARWLEGPAGQIAQLARSENVMHVQDGAGSRVVLFNSPFYLRLYEERYPAIAFGTTA